MSLETEAAVWSSRSGDTIRRTWTRATSGRVFDANTVLIQMKDGEGTLVATTEDGPADGVLAIEDLSDFNDPDAYVFGFRIVGTIAPSDLYVIEAQCEIDDDLTTFFSHSWTITPQTAVPTP